MKKLSKPTLTTSILPAFVIASIILMHSNTLAVAHDDTCKEIITAKSIERVSISKSQRLATLSLINQKNYHELNKKASGAIKDFLSGGYDAFERRMSKNEEFKSFRISQDDALDQLFVNLPNAAIDAWRDCMIANVGGLVVYPIETSPLYVVLGIEWSPHPGLGALNDVKVDHNGGMNNIKDIGSGTSQVRIDRPSRCETVIGSVGGIAGNKGAYSAGFRLPCKEADVPYFRISGKVWLNTQYADGGIGLPIEKVIDDEGTQFSYVFATRSFGEIPSPYGYLSTGWNLKIVQYLNGRECEAVTVGSGNSAQLAPINKGLEEFENHGEYLAAASQFAGNGDSVILRIYPTRNCDGG